MKQSNSEKLRALADWFDAQDNIVGRDPDDNEVQRDLRAMATEFEQLQQHGVMQVLPFSFVEWYSGMQRVKIESAYKRWMKEGNTPVASEGEEKCVCGDCGRPLTLVRPGKHQCDNRHCKSHVRSSAGSISS